MKQATKQGGKRPGSGRKPRYDEPTDTIAFRVPVSKIEAIKRLVADYLKNA